VFVTLNPGPLPAQAKPAAELDQSVRRDEEYATLGANVVVELNGESRSRRPTTRAWAIIRRAQRAHQRASGRQQSGRVLGGPSARGACSGSQSLPRAT
jgi:hypothetical protein